MDVLLALTSFNVDLAVIISAKALVAVFSSLILQKYTMLKMK